MKRYRQDGHQLQVGLPVSGIEQASVPAAMTLWPGAVRHVNRKPKSERVLATRGAPHVWSRCLSFEHEDGTTTLYGHLTHDGAVVSAGDRVLQGVLVGYSGNTGNTNNKPHLHLSAASCDPSALGTANCPTLPMNFRDTEANPQGLQQGRSYTALAY